MLAETKQPVILACNEVMGLWGKSSNWRSTRDRFQRLVTTINFDRASKDALRNIARRVLKSENVEYDTPAVEALVTNNPGDLRALVRDLQVICASAKNSIDESIVQEYVESSERDVSVEVFPGLAKLYKSKKSEDAIKSVSYTHLTLPTTSKV